MIFHHRARIYSGEWDQTVLPGTESFLSCALALYLCIPRFCILSLLTAEWESMSFSSSSLTPGPSFIYLYLSCFLWVVSFVRPDTEIFLLFLFTRRIDGSFFFMHLLFLGCFSALYSARVVVKISIVKMHTIKYILYSEDVLLR